MQVTETINEGLKREIAVVVPAKDMIAKRDERLVDLKDRVKINGFSPRQSSDVSCDQTLWQIGHG